MMFKYSTAIINNKKSENIYLYLKLNLFYFQILQWYIPFKIPNSNPSFPNFIVFFIPNPTFYFYFNPFLIPSSITFTPNAKPLIPNSIPLTCKAVFFNLKCFPCKLRFLFFIYNVEFCKNVELSI